MKADKLMNAIGGISAEHIEKYAEVRPVSIEGGALKERRGRNTKRLRTGIIAAAAALALTLAAIPVIKKLGGITPQPPDISADNSPKPTATIEAPNPSENVTPQATDMPGQYTTYFMSERGPQLSVSNAVLRDEEPDPAAFSLFGGGVFFGVEGDKLVAYELAAMIDEPGNLGYELFDPVAYYPYELGARAAKSVSDYIRRNKDPQFAGDNELQLFGYIGENYVIFTDEPFHGQQGCAIFVTGDGENCMEFGSFEGYPKEITGGCILSDKVGYICYMDRDLMRFDDYTPRRLTVYRTQDGGETWEDIGLTIPEEYEGVIAPPAAALSPVFDGDRGVILVTYSEYNYKTDGFDSKTAWFVTEDGGESWEFRME